jgi:hypothetical protein
MHPTLQRLPYQELQNRRASNLLYEIMEMNLCYEQMTGNECENN